MPKNKLFPRVIDPFENIFILFAVFPELFRCFCGKERILFRNVPPLSLLLACMTEYRHGFLPLPVIFAKVLLAFLSLIVYTIFVNMNANFRQGA